MKKQLLTLSMIIFLIAGVYAQSTTPMPIPSFNANVTSISTFVEVLSTAPFFTDGKKEMKVKKYENSGDNFQPARVWFFSLDQTTVLGPFELFDNNIVSQEVDSRPWGVIIESGTQITVDVWIYSEEASPSAGN
ncbi:MAG: hypothetical protein FJY10_08280 [Bacteroidetes bacterium]|nr:hypothetical protein [Bacteroidota bacterium]